jgi:hypothetical protein
MSAVTFDELADFGFIGTREWLTASYFVEGVEHDSHTLLVSSRGDYCKRAASFREGRAGGAATYWEWVRANIGWDVEQGRVALGAGSVVIEDVDERRAEWREQTESYLTDTGALWQTEFEEPANVIFLQFHRGDRYPSADRAEHDSPMAPAADGEGEVQLGVHPQSGDPGTWQWDLSVGIEAGNPYVATAEGINSSEAPFTGLTASWAPEATGEWFHATGGDAEMSRNSVHSWDLDLTKGELVDAAGDAAGGFRMWGNYYRCFVDYVEMEPEAPSVE